MGNLYLCHRKVELVVENYQNLNWYKNENDLESTFTGPNISLGQLAKDTAIFVSTFQTQVAGILE